jgi:hypothetical protein
MAPRHELTVLSVARARVGELDLAAITDAYHRLERDGGGQHALNAITPAVVRYALARAQVNTIERNRRWFPELSDDAIAEMRDELTKLESAAAGSVYVKRTRSIKASQ